MSGSEWMFYLALGMIIVLVSTYLIARIYIEIKKRKLTASMKGVQHDER